ncbi:MAG TPA: SDR family NAD(P)-dependent oxidoreductase [Chitinophagales bacterium]|nr:SDR family NAD(P)-dependent oxidoreductase [Chitinophagales bacterium]
MSLKNKYGPVALVAGASEGLGAAFAEYLAAEGMDLILVARRIEPLEELGKRLQAKYGVSCMCISCDLAAVDAVQQLQGKLLGKQVNLLVYNAALSYIGPFENNSTAHNTQMAQANMVTPLSMVQAFGSRMLEHKKGAVVLMASLAGFQGSGFLSVYAATKAFNRVFAESLWYEWKDRGVDVIACCAGATATPNYINTKPEPTSVFAPRVQTPEEVVKECFEKLGTRPSFVTGTGNKIASFIMQNLMPRKMAVTIMGDTTRKMYRL